VCGKAGLIFAPGEGVIPQPGRRFEIFLAIFAESFAHFAVKSFSRFGQS
jgi:hypothetical protein